jgi:hypothetical protein
VVCVRLRGSLIEVRMRDDDWDDVSDALGRWGVESGHNSSKAQCQVTKSLLVQTGGGSDKTSH